MDMSARSLNGPPIIGVAFRLAQNKDRTAYGKSLPAFPVSNPMRVYSGYSGLAIGEKMWHNTIEIKLEMGTAELFHPGAES